MKEYRTLAHALSWLLHPFLLPVYLVALLLGMTLFANYSLAMKGYLLGVVALYTILIPLLSLAVLRKLGRVSSFRVDGRRERYLPLLIAALCCLLCAITLARIPSAAFLRKVMAAAACCEVMCLLVSLRWKISLHLTGMGALVASLAVVNIAGAGTMFLPLVAAVLLSGALAAARLYLGCHNGNQILAGFCGGFVAATLSLLFL